MGFFLSLDTVDTEYMLSLHYTLIENLEGEGVAAQQAAASAWVDVPQGYSGHKASELMAGLLVVLDVNRFGR
jgi:hypothetical protein